MKVSPSYALYVKEFVTSKQAKENKCGLKIILIILIGLIGIGLIFLSIYNNKASSIVNSILCITGSFMTCSFIVYLAQLIIKLKNEDERDEVII